MLLIEKLTGLIPQEGDYGIEIEVEGHSLPVVNNKWWKTENDGSLRGEAYEYITNGAIAKQYIPAVVKYLNSRFIKSESSLSLSYRTSVHVHMNVQNLEIEKIFTITYLYYIFEELLLKLCGENRIGNRFCLRLQDAEEIVELIKYTFGSNGYSVGRLRDDAAKYCSLNLVPMKKYGSIEFRGMRGTTDTDTIVQWIGILDCLKTCQFKSPQEVVAFQEEFGIESLARNVFKEFFPFIQFEGWEREVARNISLLIDVPNTIKFGEEKKKREKIFEKYFIPQPVPVNYGIQANAVRREAIPVAFNVYNEVEF